MAVAAKVEVTGDFRNFFRLCTQNLINLRPALRFAPRFHKKTVMPKLLRTHVIKGLHEKQNFGV
jgi:hypothetical protein